MMNSFYYIDSVAFYVAEDTNVGTHSSSTFAWYCLIPLAIYISSLPLYGVQKLPFIHCPSITPSE